MKHNSGMHRWVEIGDIQNVFTINTLVQNGTHQYIV